MSPQPGEQTAFVVAGASGANGHEQRCLGVWLARRESVFWGVVLEDDMHPALGDVCVFGLQDSQLAG